MNPFPGDDHDIEVLVVTIKVSPYTHSRQRVLREYRLQRELGFPPAHAMENVYMDIWRKIGDGPADHRVIAELEWDSAHAYRYFGWIRTFTSSPTQGRYWRTGKGVTL